jgi:hypothetical protein
MHRGRDGLAVVAIISRLCAGAMRYDVCAYAQVVPVDNRTRAASDAVLSLSEVTIVFPPDRSGPDER